ncbi:unnamed protein product [Linum tenue]|uniref:VQ domain-containing protein n=1 Tax=Linum tenue TaxID=586396 RepID=A0AAV0M4Z9_9ROSI|nr:unnamed protein product [Linum tenue]
MGGSSSNSAVGRALMYNYASSSSETQQNNLFRQQSSPLASPNGNFSNSNGAGGIQIPRSDYHHHHHNHHMNPYPTTFVQASTSTFKQVVQILTGSADTAKQASSPRPQDPPPPPQAVRGSANFPIPPIKSIPNKKQQQQQLYERRSNSFKHRSLMINTLLPAAGRFTFHSNIISSSSPSSASAAEILSPSLLDFPKLTLSPVTPLNQDPFFHNNNNSSSPCPSSAGNCSSSSSSSSPLEEEDRAIAEKGFYLHPSPRGSEPQLLTLFPLTSPRAAESQPPEP